MLAAVRGLLGSALDVFGKAAERWMERALIEQYESLVDKNTGGLTPDRLALAEEVARVPEKIRDCGHVKERNVALARALWADRTQRWTSPEGREAPSRREQAGAA